jgi:hypothetical protein
MNKDSFAILVLSCDKYSDLWPPFIKQFKHYFPYQGYRIYIGSNLVPCREDGVIPILSGEDKDWSTSFKKILSQIGENNLFIILEDLFLASPVDMDLFNAGLETLSKPGIFHVKYWAIPMSLELSQYTNVCLYPKGAPYRTTVCGFWDRNYLIDLLIDGESPWDFEILGSYRTSYSEGFYGLAQQICDYRNMIEKGCWIPASLDWALHSGLKLDVKRRPLLKGGNFLISKTKMLYFDFMRQIPWRWRVAIMNKLRRVFISY